jgi:hypothetical protein
MKTVQKSSDRVVTQLKWEDHCYDSSYSCFVCLLLFCFPPFSNLSRRCPTRCTGGFFSLPYSLFYILFMIGLLALLLFPVAR